MQFVTLNMKTFSNKKGNEEMLTEPKQINKEQLNPCDNKEKKKQLFITWVKNE